MNAIEINAIKNIIIVPSISIEKVPYLSYRCSLIDPDNRRSRTLHLQREILRLSSVMCLDQSYIKGGGGPESLRLFPKFTLLPASAKLIFPTLVSDGLACKNYMEETECMKTSHGVG